MGETMKEQGSLSINSENLFPIIKKWLYSDHDIFVRELVSNGCDAIYLGMQKFGARAYSDNFDAIIISSFFIFF